MAQTVKITPATGLLEFIGDNVANKPILQHDNAGNLTLTLQATKKFTIGGNLKVNGKVTMVQQTLTDNAAIAWDFNNGANAKVTLGGNRTLVISNIETGDTGLLLVTQDGTGGRTLTLPNGSAIVGGGSYIPTATAGATDVIGVYYDGTTYWWTIGYNTVTPPLTSVGISGADFVISNSPLTSNGTIGLALATVNSNVGTFGSASAVPVITVNAKGLITAVSTTGISIPTDLNSLTDVTLTSPAANQLLQYNGSQWVNWTPNYVPNTRTLTINGTSYDLTADRAWTISTVSYTSKLQHQVKAGVAINKGQAVYVTSGDGTNMIVGLASNASESTSSKTMGLLDATVAINEFANVITEGLLEGLDTSAAGSEGDPVWLGTGGNLIYGLANKPYAPAHLVFIGIVTRKQQNNGEIFVKVQNGFELSEIHDVDLKTSVPVNGQILGYNGTLWVNKTIAQWLGFTPANDANVVHRTGDETVAGVKTFTNNLFVSPSTNPAQIQLAGTNPELYVHATSGTSRFFINRATTGNQATLMFTTGMNVVQNSAWDYSGSPLWSLGMTNNNNADSFKLAYGDIYDAGSVALEITSGQVAYFRNVPYAGGNLLATQAWVQAGYVPTGRTITINGTSYDLSANRSWTISSVSTSTQTYRGIIEDTRAAERTPNDYDDYQVSWEFTNQIPGLNYGGSSWWSLMTMQGWHDNYSAWQIIGSASSILDDFYLRSGNVTTWNPARRIWHSGDFTSTNVSNWNTAYGWGNHASAGYLTSATAATTYVSLSGSYANPSWITSLAYSKITGVPAFLTSYTETDTLATVTGRGATTSTAVTFNGNVKLGNNADLIFEDLAGTFPTSGKGFDWTLNDDGARIYAIQPSSDSIDFVFQLRDNATTNDRFVFHVQEWQGAAFDKYPLIIRGGTEFDLVDSGLFVRGTQVLTNNRVLQNISGNISMFTNDSGYITTAALSGYATQVYVNTQISNLVNGAPALLDTLDELAAALGDDANFATTITNSISGKVAKAGDTMTGELVFSMSAPQIRFADTDHYDHWIHVNSNRFYILSDRNGDGAWETPYPMELNSENNTGYIFGNVAIHAGNIGSYALTSLPTHNHDGVYVPINPDGDGPAWSYSDQNPALNGKYVGGGQRFGADGDNLTGGFLQARHLNAYDGHVNSTDGYYVGLLEYGADSGAHDTTQVIDSSGRWTGVSIADNKIASSSNWNTAYGWGNHASAGYLTAATAASTYVSLSGSYANPSWITSLAYSKITGVPAFLTSYTETDTLATVTGRGASTSSAVTFNSGITVNGSAYSIFSKPSPSGYQTVALFGSGDGGLFFTSNNAIISKGAYYNNGWIATATSGSLIDFNANGTPSIATFSGATIGSAANFNTSQVIWHAGNDGSGSGLDADLLDGLHASSFLRSDTYNSNYGGLQVHRDIGTIDGSWPDSEHTFGLENSDAGNIVINFHRAGYTSNNLRYNGTNIRFDIEIESTGRVVADGGNSSQWNTAYSWGNHASAGYLTSFSESDTLATVVSRGSLTYGTINVAETAGGGYVFRTSSSWGGWARNAFTISDGSGNLMATIGGYGGSGTTLSYLYIGKSYTDYSAYFNPDGGIVFRYDNTTRLEVDNLGVQISGRLSSGWGYFSSSTQGTPIVRANQEDASAGYYLFQGTTGGSEVFRVNRLGDIFTSTKIEFTDSTTGISKSGGRLTIRSESIDNVANFADYGMYLPRTGQAAGLYVESPIEARGGLRLGSGAVNGTITYGADTAATGNRLVQRDSSGNIYGNYILGAYANFSSGNSENPTIGQIWTQNTSDNYLRKSTPAHFRSQVTDGYYLPMGGGTLSGGINLSNNNLEGVGHIVMADSGFGEGIQWENWFICDSPNDNSNSAGNLQFVYVPDNSVRMTFDTGGTLTLSNRLIELSSIRYKTNIESLTPALDKVMHLRPVNYVRIGGTGETEIGLIAEEVAEIYPELIKYNEEGQVDGINYTRIAPILIKTIQEQQDLIKKLTKRIDDLENR